MEAIVIILLLVGAAYGLGWCVWIKRPLDHEQHEQAEQQTHWEP